MKTGMAVRSRTTTLGLMLTATLSLATTSPAGNLDLSQPTLLLATTKTGTMQDELEQAAAAGYRLVAGSPTSGSEVMLVMERVADQAAYHYVLLATSRTGTMTKEMNEAAAQGYRVVPSTLLAKKGFLGDVEILVVMEKPTTAGALPPPPTEYLLLATNRTGTLEKEILAARGNGFNVLCLSSRDEHLAIVEKRGQ